MDLDPDNVTMEMESAAMDMSVAQEEWETASFCYNKESLVIGFVIDALLEPCKDANGVEKKKPMAAFMAKVPPMGVPGMPLDRDGGNETCNLTELARAQFYNLYKDLGEDGLQKVADEWFDSKERELKMRVDVAAAALKSAQDVHAEKLHRCYLLSKHQEKLVHDLRLDYLEANGGPLPPFPVLHEMPAAPVATRPDFPEPPHAAVFPQVDGQAAAAPGHATTHLVAAGPVFKALAALGAFLPGNN
ncbi:unnamed protein product, partial [Mesorhabditis spiculigera]